MYTRAQGQGRAQLLKYDNICYGKTGQFHIFSKFKLIFQGNDRVVRVGLIFNKKTLLLLKDIFEFNLLLEEIYISNFLKNISRFPNTGQMFPISVLFGEIYRRPFSRSIAEFTNWPSDKSPHEEEEEEEIGKIYQSPFFWLNFSRNLER